MKGTLKLKSTKRIASLGLVLGLVLGLMIFQKGVSQTNIVNYTSSYDCYCLLVENTHVWTGSPGGLVCWDRVSGNYQNYTTAEGLPDLHINCITRDRAGRLWAATDEGLAWFNGSCWEVSLKCPNVEDLAVDANNGLWVTAGSGIYKFNGKEWSLVVSTFQVTGDYLWSRCLYVGDQNSIWVGTERGIIRFDGQNWSYHKSDGLPSEDVTAIFKDSRGNYWFGTFAGGVVRWDGTHWDVFDTTNGLAFNWVEDIKEDQKGHIWVATTGSDCWEVNKGGLNEWDGHQWAKYDTTSGLSSNYIREIAFDREGNPWLATGKGINYWDGQQWQCLQTDDIFTSAIINDIFIDEQGNLWLATGACALVGGFYRGGGLVKFDGTHSVIYDTDDGLPHRFVCSVAGDHHGYLWIGTWDGGLSRFDGKEFVNFTRADPGFKYITKVFVDHLGRKWIGHLHGISVFNDTTWTDYPVYAFDIAEDSAGYIWVAAGSNGLFCFNNGSYSQIQGLPSDCGDAVAVSVDRDDHLWIGTDDGGLIFYDGSHFVTYTEADGLPSSDISAVDASAFSEKEQQYLLVGTWKGIGILKEDGWFTVSENEGLVDNHVRCLLSGGNSDIWVGTLNGLSHLHGFLTTSVNLEEKTPLGTHHSGSNYPNPFSTSTIFQLKTSTLAPISLTIYNLLGQRIRTLVTETNGPGICRIRWDGKDDQGISLPSGIYLCVFRTGNKEKIQKVLLLR